MSKLRLGLALGYASGPQLLNRDIVLEAERLGFDSVWTAEAYGSDALTPLAYIAALTTKIRLGTSIIQMPARTPTATAMAAMTLDALSGGRFILGLGPSGPQVVEGWYGVAYGKPLTITREYIQIIRKILARDEPLTFKGEHYEIPYAGPGATGLGKPLQSIIRGRKDMEIYTASIGPAGIATSAEVADGLIPVWMNPERFDLFQPHLDAGFAKAGGGKSLANFDVAPFVSCVVGSDLDACRRPLKENLALYIGGMGARSKNFYNDFAIRLGYGAEAAKIQDLYLSGKKNEAAAMVPDKLVDETALIGDKARIRERLQAWEASPVKTLLIRADQPEALRTLAELAL